MPRYNNKFARVSTVLVSAVADAGTFTVAYPTGFVQADFTNGLGASGGHYAIVNGNDRWAQSDSKMAVTTFGASTITITNNSAVTWAAGSTVEIFIDIQDGNNVIDLVFPVELASIATAQDIVTDFVPGVDGYIEAISWVQNKVVTTASKLASINAEIGTTDLTGGVVALTSATCTPMGAVIQGSAITGNNRITKKDTLSLEASSVTAFAEGNGSIHVRIRLDDADRI